MLQHTLNGRILTVTVAGEIDHHTAAALRYEIDALVQAHSPRCLILDFSKVDFCDSSGIALVLGRYRKMRSLGGETELCGLTENIRHIFEMADLKRLIKIH